MRGKLKPEQKQQEPPTVIKRIRDDGEHQLYVDTVSASLCVGVQASDNVTVRSKLTPEQKKRRVVLKRVNADRSVVR